jgi:hypothetical protein
MTGSVTPESFWNVFESKLVAATQAQQNWTGLYESDLLWSGLMMQVSRSTGARLAFPPERIYTEYFRLDMAWFKYPDLERDPFTWNLEAAIEHENGAGQWYDEWVKLNHIACGLKVLVSYHNYRGRQTLEEALEHAREIYRRLLYKPSNNSWLLIFGPTCQQPELPWRGYTFDGKELRERFGTTLVGAGGRAPARS